MTPDQALKTALVGETAPTLRKPRRPASRRFRWTVRLLCLALSLMITRGLMQAPEVRAFWAEGRATLEAFLAEERALVAARAEADARGALQAKAQVLPDNRVTVNRGTGGTGGPAPRVLSGTVEEVLAGNAFLLEGTPLVLDGLACAAPDSGPGREAVEGLHRLTRAERLRCTVTGPAGAHAFRAQCSLKGGRDLASQMRADRLCAAG